MPDITMCSGLFCPEWGRCYRAQAKPSNWQVYYNFELTCTFENGFPDFMPIHKKKIKKKG